MIDQFFARFMQTDAGKALLIDIPAERKKLVEKKMQAAFFAGVEISPVFFVMDQVHGMNDNEKKLLMQFLKDELNL